MLTHLGFSAWIVVDGKEVPEYLVAVDNEANRVSCWIPGEEGQRFSVYWRDHGGKVDTCAFITLDGFVVPGRFLFGEGVACREGVRTSRTTERPFVFQRVHADVTSGTQSTSKDVGMITLRIKRITRVASKPANSILPLPSVILGKRKAGDICVSFGEEAPAFEQYASTWSVKSYEQDDSLCKTPKTYVSFVFRYRTRDFLEGQGIIPETENDGTKPSQRPLMRRIASLPSSMPSSMAPTPPDSPEMIGPPFKRRRMILNDNGPRRPQGHSTDARRAVSWKIITSTESAPVSSTNLMPIQFSYVSPVSGSVNICEAKGVEER